MIRPEPGVLTSPGDQVFRSSLWALTIVCQRLLQGLRFVALLRKLDLLSAEQCLSEARIYAQQVAYHPTTDWKPSGRLSPGVIRALVAAVQHWVSLAYR